MEEVLDKRKFILATIDRIEKEKAILKLDDGQSLDWSVVNLPVDVAEGSRVKLILSSDKTEEKEREELAKTVLNEILKTE